MNDEKMIFSLEFGKSSSKGASKTHNEDAIGYYLPDKPEKLHQRGQMFLVVDAHGKEEDGEIASKLIVETTIQNYFDSPWNDDVKHMLSNALKKANRVVFEANTEKADKGYFTCSVMCAIIQGDTLFIAGTGDCSAYLFRNDILENIFEKAGSEKSKSAPDDSIHSDSEDKSKYLGYYENAQIDVIQRQIQLKDSIFICSDSIVQAMPVNDLRLVISTKAPLQTCETVVQNTLQSNPDEDATAIMIKVKGIKRLTFEEEELPVETPPVIPEPKEREIVIKGVRYRSKMDDEQTPDDKSMDDFSNDRNGWRGGLRRTKQKPPPKESGNNFNRFLNLGIIIAIIAIFAFIAFKYIPDYWNSLTETTKVQRIKSMSDSTDTFGQSDTSAPLTEPDSTVFIADEDITEPAEDTVKQELPQIEPPEEIDEQISLDVAIVNGSTKRLTLANLINRIRSVSGTNSISSVKSSYRLTRSKIIWRRPENSEIIPIVKDKVDQYSSLFNQIFNINPEVNPLDFTIVIGEDFKLPPIQDRYLAPEEQKENMYLEILNGYKIGGMARMLSNQLHNQNFENHRLEIIDYRNADHSNYPKSFIKCDSTHAETARKLASQLGLPELIIHEPLFEIKILIGSDIKL